MQRKTFRTMICPVARTLDRVGEWWSMLILRDAFHGLTRFDQFQTSLGIAPNMLTRRLASLVKAGLLERRLYSRHPPRHEYHLTGKGRDFWSVLVALSAYGNRHFANEGVASHLVDSATGEAADPIFVDRETGRPIDQEKFKFAAGPAADATLRMRMRYSDERRAKREGREEWDEYVRLRAVRPKSSRARKRAGLKGSR